MDSRKYVLVGTGARVSMFFKALVSRYTQNSALVAMCDTSQTRMDWHNSQIKDRYDADPIPTYFASDFDEMLEAVDPHTVIVCTPDALHHEHIIRALDAGCDVITEKPLTTDAEKLRAIFDAIERSGRQVWVAFNYRFAPAYTKLRELIAEGVIGQPLNVDFSWLLDVYHGADYFRRWHREKAMSGGLLVQKATHHFDLVNWMCVVARYDNGVLLSYNLIAYAPCEGLRVAITGTRGRVELDIVERIEQAEEQQEGVNLGASKGAFDTNYLRVYPQFAPPYEVEILRGEGGHGGADPLMLQQIFAPDPPPDLLGRNATHIDGAASIMLGIAANRSIVTGQPVVIDDLFPLPRG
jgi:hypothetical protein